MRNVLNSALHHLLPSSYPSSVAPCYAKYSSLQFLSNMSSSTSAVLSTQALLQAVGLGPSSIPISGALNWVVKDLLGQLGGVMFASYLGKTKAFDSNPKRWRFASSVAMDASVFLELLCPFFPSAFLPIAAVANAGKNMSYLSASASRAALHNAMAVQSNLADITAKAGSQTVLAGMLGTAVGCGFLKVFGNDFDNVFQMFCACSFLHMYGCWSSLRCVVLNTINKERLNCLLEIYLREGRVPAPEEVAAVENFTFRRKTNEGGDILYGVAVEQISEDWGGFKKAMEATKGENWIVKAAADGNIHV